MDLNQLKNYSLIGIGEFSHGICESWEYRFKLLKYCISKTNKKIIIFNEMSIWQGENIMNNTIFVRKDDKWILQHYKGIRIETPENNWGKLRQYCPKCSESQIFINIIKYIRKYKDRIAIIGVDNDKLNRDRYMYRQIMKNLDPNNINFLWAHNEHIDNREISNCTYRWIRDEFPNERYTAGYYLKKKLKEKYCIILSQAYKGKQRFDSICSGDNCEERTYKEFFTKLFIYKVLSNRNDGLYKYYDDDLIEFSNSYFVNNKQGEIGLIPNKKTWDFILFWKSVSVLETI